MRIILSVLTLFALWLLLSGVYKPMVVGLGLVCSLVAVLVVRRMGRMDGHWITYPLNPLKLVGYFLWLLVEIAKSNLAVTRLIISRNMGLRQHLFKVPRSQKSELAEVIFANSITLTPGTITVETETEAFWVHAICFDESDPAALAQMDARVSAIETRAA